MATTPSKQKAAPPTVVLRQADYAPPQLWVTHVNLSVTIPNDIHTEPVEITSLLTWEPSMTNNNNKDHHHQWLVLDGDCQVLELQSLAWVWDAEDSNETERRFEPVPETDYQLDSNNNQLRVRIRHDSPILPKLQTTVRLSSLEKTELSGLFHRPRSRKNPNTSNSSNPSVILTHCEPIGFRQITFFPDRPDNTAIFTTRIEASQQDYPLLLSNGDLIESGVIPQTKNKKNSNHTPHQRHYVIYHDPHPKPSYIFALLASPACAHLHDTYHTDLSGRPIDIHIYCPDYDPDNTVALAKLQFALHTIQKAMAFDEQHFGVEYDGHAYTIVALQSFTLGAMENQHLNFFQTSLIATSPATTTDVTYDLVEKTIAHEYFHYWSGNRVSIRDWFQFGLKEGLTVFRDQEFCAAAGGESSIARIEAVKILQEKQFAEDASSDRRPVLPEDMKVELSTSAYLDSLASSTSYHKGAEIIRMCQTILGRDIFREGLSLYFERYKDGHGATCHDFLSVMQDVATKHNHDFAHHIQQFSLWYTQAGTPLVTYNYAYDAESKKLSLTFRQSFPHLDGDENISMYIPITVGLLQNDDGTEVVSSTVLHLKKKEETFCFENLQKAVTPSILRGFSAPVQLKPEDSLDDEAELHRMAFLAAYDTDGYNRWQAMQQLYTKCIMGLMHDEEKSKSKENMSLLLTAFRQTLENKSMDHATKSYLLKLPSVSILSRDITPFNPLKVYTARQQISSMINSEFKDDVQELYDQLASYELSGTEASTETKARAERVLRNTLLHILCDTTDGNYKDTAAEIALAQFEDAQCFSDKLSAFQCLSSMEHPNRIESIQKFFQYAVEVNDTMVLNKWFQVQALSHHPEVLDHVKQLTQNPNFRATNVGQFRSLIASFTMNAKAFHTPEGYRFIGGVISQMDRVAPTLAVELLMKGFANWPRYSSGSLMKTELQRIAGSKTSDALANAIQRVLQH